MSGKRKASALDAALAKFQKVQDVRIRNQCNDLLVELKKP